MTTDPDPELLRLAEKLSDASPVDWDEASDAYPALTPTLTGLQQVEAVAGAFRSSVPEPTNADAAEPTHWGRLTVLDLIGAGNFGEVYRAHDPLLDRDVALKLRKPVPDDDEPSARRALEEGRRLARVRHPNVLTVHGADVDRDRVGLWTELIDGPNIRDVVAADGPLEPTGAIAAAIAVCRALNAVHGADLVHGDVKASNVFCGGDGRIVLGDFGSASELDSSGVVSGSPVSLAPERLLGADAEPASDVYSAGVLLYFMLSGYYPVGGKDVEAILEQHEARGPIPLGHRLPDAPSDLVNLVDRAVAGDPAKRFATARELERELEMVLGAHAEPGSALKETTPPRTMRQRVLWSAVAAVAALAVFAIIVRAALSPSPPPQLVVDARLVLDEADGPVVLADGAPIAPGDRLYLEIEAASPVHVYVANEDEAGAVFTLFPVPGLDLTNPIPPGRHRLPGTIDGAANDWQVTSAGGAETFLVVAAPEPLPELEHQLSAWAAASADRPVGRPEGGGQTLRGIGSLAPATATGTAGARLSDIQNRLVDPGGRRHPLWLRRFVLNSPGQ